MSNSSNSSVTWLGTSLEEIYGPQGPWNYAVTPVIPSRHHHILYEVPAKLGVPPKPHYNAQPKHWDEDHVRMPYSSHSLFMIKEGDQDVIQPRWDIICNSLSGQITSIDELEQAINSYNNNLPKFEALQYFFNNILEEEASVYFFADILPKIINLALQLPNLIPGSFPLLRKNQQKSVSLSQLQIASLLANAFLCTFIWRKEMSHTYPGINFVRLFAAHDRPKRANCINEKLKCIFHYFERVTTTNPVGCVTFERKYLLKTEIPRWDKFESDIGNTKIHIDSSGTIEDGHGLLQVDFANKFVGGGVIGYGCVQEEIRFVICPELIVSRLFIEQLGDNDAVTITGVERFSNYSGYGDSFTWTGGNQDDTPFDDYGRRRTSIIVIDATRFNKPSDQFYPSAILREVNKAYVGFRTREIFNCSPVATGNWGCGAFKGDVNLKSLIQLMACNAANRNLVYFSFGNETLRNEFHQLHSFLATNKIKISQLWRFLCRFCSSNLSHDKLYSFIQQCYFDTQRQTSIQDFFGLQSKMFYSNKPSTSAETPVSTQEYSNSKRASIKSPLKPATVIPKNKNVPLNNDDNDDDDIIRIIDLIDGKTNSGKVMLSAETPASTQEFSNGKRASIKSPLKLATVIPKNKNVPLNNDDDDDDDIIRIIDLIDGKTNSGKVKDTVKDSNKDFGNLNKTCYKNENCDLMEVVEVKQVMDEKKRKITDYFPKANNFS